MNRTCTFFILILISWSLSAQVVHNDGLLFMGNNAVVRVDANLNNNTSGTIDMEGQVQLRADFVNNGSATSGTEAEVLFISNDQTQPQSIEGNSVTQFTELVVQNGNFVQLNANNLVVTKHLEIIDGSFDINDNVVLLAATGTIIGETQDGDRVFDGNTTPGSGGYIIAVASVDGNNINPGNMGLVFNNNGDAQTITVMRGHDISVIDGVNSIERSYTLQGADELSSDLYFRYADADAVGADESELLLWSSKDGGATWSTLGGTNAIALNNISLAAYTEGSAIITARAEEIIEYAPELRLMDAYANGCNAEIIWQVENETGIVRYELQHSNDGVTYETVYTEVATHKSGVQTYNYQHETPGETPFYRVRIVTEDGNEHFSEIALTDINCDDNPFALYPNPVQTQNVFHVLFETELKEVTVMIYAADGKVVATKSFATEAGYNKITMDVTNIVPGSYWVKLVEMDVHRKLIRG